MSKHMLFIIFIFFYFLWLKCNSLAQVFLGTIPSLRACATVRSSSSPSTPWRPRPCTRRAAAPTTTTNKWPTRTSSPASCEVSAGDLQTRTCWKNQTSEEGGRKENKIQKWQRTTERPAPAVEKQVERTTFTVFYASATEAGSQARTTTW